MSTIAISKRPGALRHSLGEVPWRTTLTLAVVLAYADGFWMVSVQGAVGAMQRTDDLLASWLRQSTVLLPVFVLAVLAALTLARRWFGPDLNKVKVLLPTMLLIVATATIASLAAVAGNSTFDYHLQNQLHAGSMAGMGDEHGASVGMQVRAIVFVSRWILLTNIALVTWLVAFWGGGLKAGTAGDRNDEPSGALPASTSDHGTDQRLLLVGSLLAAAAIHAGVVPAHMSEWNAAGIFFVVLAVWEIGLAGMVLARFEERLMLVAAGLLSLAPLVLWLTSRTVGLPFGPEAGAREIVGLADSMACLLELTALVTAVVLLRRRGLVTTSRSSAHVKAMVLVGLVAVTALGVAGTGLGWADAFDIHGNPSVMDMGH